MSVIPLVATTATVLDAGKYGDFMVTTRLSAEMLVVTLPVSRVPFANKARLLLIVPGFSDLEKVSTTATSSPTPIAPSLGVTLITVGGVVSAPAPVMNELENAVPWRPERSTTTKVLP